MPSSDEEGGRAPRRTRGKGLNQDSPQAHTKSEEIQNSSQNPAHPFLVSASKFGSNTSPSTRNMSPSSRSRIRQGFNTIHNSKQSRLNSDIDCLPNSYNTTPWKDLKSHRRAASKVQICSAKHTYHSARSTCTSHSCSPTRSLGSHSIRSQPETENKSHHQNKVLDLYIDCEQKELELTGLDHRCPRVINNMQFFRGRSYNSINEEHKELEQTRLRNRCSRDPIKTNNVTGVHGRSYSNMKLNGYDVSRDLNCEGENEPPRKLAKDVVKRLSRCQTDCSFKPRDVSSGTPDLSYNVHGKHFDGHSSPIHSFLAKRTCNPNLSLEEEFKDMVTEELQRKLKRSQERVMVLSEELKKESSSDCGNSSTSTLHHQRIRNLTEEQRKLWLEMSAQLQCQIVERAAAEERLLLMKKEMNLRIERVSKEKSEVQFRLQRELRRRSNQWALEVEKYNSEQCRLRDQLRHLASQNVALQREVSSAYHKEKDQNQVISCAEAQLKELTEKMDATTLENQMLQETSAQIKDKRRALEDDLACAQRNCRKEEKENGQLAKLAARLQKTCSEQERTIDGLRQLLNMEGESRQSLGHKVNHETSNLQMEQLRLIEIEQSLRKELATYRLECHSLRHENIYLLERLQGTGFLGGSSSVKLEKELVSRVQCLQDLGMSLLNGTIQISDKLLTFLKSNGEHVYEVLPRQDTQGNHSCLEGYSLMEYDMKIQSFKHSMEQLARSLEKVNLVLKGKAELEDERSDSLGGNTSQDDMRSELKAETLVTSILKEKLYSKEEEIEQLQAQLAAAYRNHDVLKIEVQNAVDTYSCINHKLKDLEIQMIRKEGIIDQLQNDLKAKQEELAVGRGIISKISKERDSMWDEVKQYSERNMLQSYEINSLNKKIEALEEDILVKDGQISILKDSLSNKPLDLLSESDIE